MPAGEQRANTFSVPDPPAPDALRTCLIIGSGVAGLQVARQLQKVNYQVLILEASSDIGGVWSNNYVGYGLQVPWRTFQFPEFLWPKELQPTTEFPTGQQVQEYIRAFARHYDLLRLIRFNCKVLRLRWHPSSRMWEALYADSAREKFFKVKVDYVAVCTGMYCNPFIPKYTGTEKFAGVQLHAKEFADLSVAKGRRVLVVGAGKTAVDCVITLMQSRLPSSVTMLYRQSHWPVPRTVLGLNVCNLLFNRATPSMLPPYYTASRAVRTVHAASLPIKRLFWKTMEVVIAKRFRISEEERPRVGLPEDLFYGGQILDDSFTDLVGSEGYTSRWGEINSFVRNGVILQDGSFLPVDVVLYGTGYEKSYDCFDGEVRARLGLQKDGLYLYRNCLPCEVPHLAFVGSEVSTYSNILTHGLQALWLSRVLSGQVKLPSPADMSADVRAQQHWRRSIMPAQRNRGAILQLYGLHYHDQLLTDMGISPRRKGLNLLAECFRPYLADDYTPLMGSLPGEARGRNAADSLGQRSGSGGTTTDVDTADSEALLFKAAAAKELGSDSPLTQSSPTVSTKRNAKSVDLRVQGAWLEVPPRANSCTSRPGAGAAAGGMPRKAASTVRRMLKLPSMGRNGGGSGSSEPGYGPAPGFHTGIRAHGGCVVPCADDSGSSVPTGSSAVGDSFAFPPGERKAAVASFRPPSRSSTPTAAVASYNAAVGAGSGGRRPISLDAASAEAAALRRCVSSRTHAKGTPSSSMDGGSGKFDLAPRPRAKITPVGRTGRAAAAAEAYNGPESGPDSCGLTSSASFSRGLPGSMCGN